MASKETWIHGAPMRYFKVHLFMAVNGRRQPVFFGAKYPLPARLFWRETTAYTPVVVGGKYLIATCVFRREISSTSVRHFWWETSRLLTHLPFWRKLFGGNLCFSAGNIIHC